MDVVGVDVSMLFVKTMENAFSNATPPQQCRWFWGFGTINSKSLSIVKCNDAYPQILAKKSCYDFVDDGQGMPGKNMYTPMLTAHAFHMNASSCIPHTYSHLVSHLLTIIYLSQISFTVNEWNLYFIYKWYNICNSTLFGCTQQ